MRGLARHALDGDDALLARLVSEHRAGDDVADREHARHARFEALVHRDAAALVEGEAELAGAEPVRVRPPADRDQHDVGLGLGGAPLRGERHADAARRPRRAAGLGLEAEGQPLPLERPLELRGHAAIHAGQDAVEDLDHGHLGAEPAPDRAELEPHGAGTDHQHPFGHPLERQRLGGAHDALAVEGQASERRRLAAARDQDARGLERLLAVPAAQHDPPRAPEPGRALDPGDLVLLEQRSDALGEAPDDAVLARHHRTEVELHPVHLDAVGAEPVARLVVEFARVEERLRGDAAHVEARAAQRPVLLDAGDAHPELGGADGGDVPARSGADHDEVVAIGRHHTSRSRRDGSSRRSFTRTRKVTACSPSTRRWS